jgi:hypothetical protein
MANQAAGESQTRTSIDSLLELLRERGKSELTSISAALGVGTTILEQWAKVLEEGKLIRVTYEMGKMYMEPTNLAPEQMQDIKTKSAAEKFTLDNQMELQKLSVDKFYKSLTSLSTGVNTIDQLYRKKLPQVRKMLEELDRLYAPMDQKVKALNEIKQSSDAYLAQLESKMEAMYTKLGLLNMGNIDAMWEKKTALLDETMKKTASVQDAITSLEDTKKVFYQQLESETDKRVREFKRQLKKSVDEAYASVKRDTAETAEIRKSLDDDVAKMRRLTSEAARTEKEAERMKRALVSTRESFIDRYKKVADEINMSGNTYEVKYEEAVRESIALRASMGAAAKIDEFVKNARAELAAIKIMIEADKKEVDALISALKVLEADKTLSVEKRAQAVDEIRRRVADTTAKSARISKALDKAGKSLKEPGKGS